MFIKKHELTELIRRIDRLECEANTRHSSRDPYEHDYDVPMQQTVKLILEHIKMKPSPVEAQPAGFKLIKDLPLRR